MDITQFIEPELFILIVAIYVVGMFLKRSKAFSDNMIPAMLGVISIILAVLYVGSTQGFSFPVVVSAFIQGILIAGAAVYGDQIIKQIKKGS